MQCPNCQKSLQGDFRFCPYCGVEVINNTCRNCHKEVDPAWVSCPYCGSNLKAPIQQPIRQEPVQRPEEHYPPYAHGHYGSSSSNHYRKRKGFLGHLFS